jgi:putative OPT family oligopeptide transporter
MPHAAPPEPRAGARRGLPPEAYEAIPGDRYVPYVPAERSIPELTVKSVVIGILLGVVFGAANAYLGLRVGLTVSASIPAAVMAIAIFRVLRRGTILETNIVQTIGSAGESLAAGVIFTLPALYIWGMDVEWYVLATVAFLGALLGVLFMIPLRRFLMSREHGVLPFPEGTATAEVQVAG